MKKYLLLAIISSVVVGCARPDIYNEGSSTNVSTTSSIKKDANLTGESYKAANSLKKQASYLQSDLKPILITSIANITDLNSSSALGLMVSEQIGNRISQFGFPVVDLRTRKGLKVREKSGEFMLSRDVRKISRRYAAGAVLVGTYAVGRNTVYISTRLVRPEDNRILASYNFGLPMGPDVSRLVRTKTK